MELCLDCAWCDLRVEFEAGSQYCCGKSGTVIADVSLHKRACKDFIPAGE